MNQKTKFKQTEIGMIPEDWEVKKLGGYAVKIGSGITPRGGSSVYISHGVALIRSQNVYNEGFNKEGLAYIDNETAELMKNVELQEGDILLNITGDSVARCCITPSEVLPARVNQHVLIIRTKKELNPYFLRYYLVSNSTQRSLLSFADSGGTRQALTKTMIESFNISFTGLEEQSSIASILSSLDSKIELNEQMNKTLEAIGQAIFKHWFVDFEFPNEKGKPYKSSGGEMVDSELGEVPKGWEVGKYEDLVTISTGKGLKREKFIENGGFPVLGANGELGRTDNYLFDEKLILTGRVGTLGTIYLVKDKVWISDNVLISKPKFDEAYYYAYFIIKAFDFKSLNRGSTQPLVTQTDLKNQRVTVPDKRILKLFHEVCLQLFDKIYLNNTNSKNLSKIRDSLLPKLMSGKIRVGIDNG